MKFQTNEDQVYLAKTSVMVNKINPLIIIPHNIKFSFQILFSFYNVLSFNNNNFSPFFIANFFFFFFPY